MKALSSVNNKLIPKLISNMEAHPSVSIKKGDKILGRKYLLKHTLGKGQQSKVKLGIRLSDGLTCAIKVHYGLSEEDKVKLSREVLAL
jgi:hypothetical protein